MENKYLKYGNKYDCNGCGICTLVCPKKCIRMEQDNEGFYYPVIDEEKCIHCNRCKNICSNDRNVQNYNRKAYIAINNNDIERKKSASGGMFIILAKYVIEKEGVVFGVKYDDNLNVVHDEATAIEECEKFMGSKYVRSECFDIYEKVRNYLEKNRWVLFTGTPCQCNALKVYLNKDYEKLIICEIICHGNPSPTIFKKYVEEKEKIKSKKIIDIKFRSKENGWSNSTPIIEYEDKSKEEDPTLYRAFMAELISRPSCYPCNFVDTNRISDFTIGDMWGIAKIKPDMNDGKGVSLVVVSSDKGKKVLDELKDKMRLQEIDIDVAFLYNHHKNVKENKKRSKFFKNMDKNKSIINLMQKYSKKTLISKIVDRGKRVILNKKFQKNYSNFIELL